MQPLGAIELFLCALIVLVAFAVRGTAGFGGGAISVPLLALMLPVQTVVPVVAVLGLVASVGHGLRERRHIAWHELARIGPFMLVGVAVALYLFQELDAKTLRKGLGAFVIAYAVLAFATSERPLGVPRRYAWALAASLSTMAGFIGGPFGGAAGPLYVIYYDAIQLAKDAFRVTVTTTLLMLSVMRTVGYIGLGFYDAATLLLLAFALPCMFLGAHLAEKIAGRIDQRTFNRIVGAVLVVSGSALLLK